jgi:hypothetical protein
VLKTCVLTAPCTCLSTFSCLKHMCHGIAHDKFYFHVRNKIYMCVCICVYVYIRIKDNFTLWTRNSISRETRWKNLYPCIIKNFLILHIGILCNSRIIYISILSMLYMFLSILRIDYIISNIMYSFPRGNNKFSYDCFLNI